MNNNMLISIYIAVALVIIIIGVYIEGYTSVKTYNYGGFILFSGFMAILWPSILIALVIGMPLWFIWKLGTIHGKRDKKAEKIPQG